MKTMLLVLVLGFGMMACRNHSNNSGKDAATDTSGNASEKNAPALNGPAHPADSAMNSATDRTPMNPMVDTSRDDTRQSGKSSPSGGTGHALTRGVSGSIGSGSATDSTRK
jgi:hypothetical protein